MTPCNYSATGSSMKIKLSLALFAIVFASTSRLAASAAVECKCPTNQATCTTADLLPTASCGSNISSSGYLDASIHLDVSTENANFDTITILTGSVLSGYRQPQKLESLTMPDVKTIGGGVSATQDDGKLETINFPLLNSTKFLSIYGNSGVDAKSHAGSFKSVSFPELTYVHGSISLQDITFEYTGSITFPKLISATSVTVSHDNYCFKLFSSFKSVSSLSFPEMTSSGSITFAGACNVAFSAPKLTKIAGDLKSIATTAHRFGDEPFRGPKVLSLPSLTSITGNIHVEDFHYTSSVHSSRDLDFEGMNPFGLSVPNLQSVGGYVNIDLSGKALTSFDASKLTSIGGNLWIKNGVQSGYYSGITPPQEVSMSIPALNSTGGKLQIHDFDGLVSVSFASLTYAKEISVYKNPKMTNISFSALRSTAGVFQVYDNAAATAVILPCGGESGSQLNVSKVNVSSITYPCRSPTFPSSSPGDSKVNVGERCTSADACTSGACKGEICCKNDKSSGDYSLGCAKCGSTSDSPSKSVGHCKQCLSGYYLDSKLVSSIGKCVACDANCASCKESGPGTSTCMACQSGYYVDTLVIDTFGKCVKCGLNCDACKESGPGKSACQKCRQGFNVSTTAAADCVQTSTSSAATSPSPPPAFSTGTRSVLKVTGIVTLSGYTKETFGSSEKNAFAAAMAKLAGPGVKASDVTLAVEDVASRRHLFAESSGVKVTYEIETKDTATAKTLQLAIKAKDSNIVVQEMKAAGLNRVTTATVTVDDTVKSYFASAAAPPPSKAEEQASQTSSSTSRFAARSTAMTVVTAAMTNLLLSSTLFVHA